MSFFTELKRRNVIRMAGLYLVGAWLFVQIAETLLPIFDTPGWVLKVLVVLLALGFVPALMVSWLYELTPDGLKRDAEVSPAQSIAAGTGQRMDRLILAGLALLIGLTLADRYWPRSAVVDTLGDPSADNAVGDNIAADEPLPTAEAENQQTAIAVMPFANMSGDPAQDYFSDGMTEELLNVLARVPDLKVAARTSVFQFKDGGGDIREIGRTLGVSHVLEGSIRREGDQVRVTTQLIRVSDGFHVWSENYDRELKSVFALQDDIAQRVSDQLVSTLGAAAVALPTRADIDPVAYDEYLQGRALHRARTHIPTAIFHFRNAVTRAPEFAEAWANLTLSYDVLVGRVGPLERMALGNLLENAREGATRAAELAPNAAPTLHALGNVARLEGRYLDAETLYERSIAADAGYADVREDYSELLDAVGREADALKVALELVEREPLVPIFLWRVVRAGMQMDREAIVLDHAKRIDAINPDIFLASSASAGYRYQLQLWRGEVDAARQTIDALQASHPEKSARDWVLLRWAQRHPEIDDATARAFIATNEDYATYAAVRGDADLFFQSISHTRVSYSGFYLFDFLSVRVARPYLADPRAKQLLRENGFEAYWRVKGWPALCRPLGEDDFECGDFVKEAE